jgi:hypothetical protein
MAAKRTYELKIPADRSIKQGLKEARERGAEVGVKLVGDEKSGEFSGAAAGRYRIEGRTLHLEVDKKPLIVPWALIESQLKKLFP